MPINLAPNNTPGGGVTTVKPILWQSLGNVLSFTAADFAQLAAWGYTGVVCVIGGNGIISGFVYGFSTNSANSQYFSASPTGGSQYSQENSAITNGLAALAHAHGISLYLGFYIIDGSQTGNGIAPMSGDWFNNTQWTAWNAMCSDMAAGAAHMGFDGLAFDTEGGPNAGAFGILWSWNYTGNSNNQATTNAQANSRGQSMMSSMQSGWTAGGGSGQMPVFMYCSTQVGSAQIPLSYYDRWATWFNAHEGGSYPAANSSVFYQWVEGLAVNSTAPIVLGSAVYYGQADVNQFGPYGSLGSGQTNPWGGGSVGPNQSALRDDLYALSQIAWHAGSQVQLCPFIWPGSDSNGNTDGGQWTNAEFQSSPNGFLPNLINLEAGGFYLIYTQHNPPVDYSFANDTGVDYVTPLNLAGQAAGVSGAWSLVQQTSTVTSHTGSTQAVLTISASGPNNTLQLIWCNPEDAATISSVIDSKGQNWVKSNSLNDPTTADYEIWTFKGSVSGVTSVTVNLTGGSVAASSHGYNVSEWHSTVSTAGTLDTSPAGNTGSSATASAGPSGTPAAADGLFLAVVCCNLSLSGAPGGGFTAMTTTGWPANATCGYLISSDAASHTMTQGLSGSTTWGGLIASFKPS